MLQFEEIVKRAHSRDTEFPAKQLQRVFDRFLHDNVSGADASTLRSTLAPLTDIIDKYLNGLKPHEFEVFVQLFEKYYAVESIFSGRQNRDEEVILALRDQNKDKLSYVAQTVLSHTRSSSKNQLIVEILDAYRPNKAGVGNVADFFKPSLQKLAELEGRPVAKVSLKARELLIQCAMPSLEERTQQMEHILRSAVLESRYGESGWDHREPDFDVIKEVVDSKHTVFDVLPQFFVHKDPWVSLAALEVYTRRAYRAYQMKTIDYVVDNDAPYVLSWEFALRKVGESEFGLSVESSQPSAPGTPGESFARQHSISDMNYLSRKAENSNAPVRRGAVVPIPFIDEADEYIMKALETFPVVDQNGNMKGSKGLSSDMANRRGPQVAISKPEHDDELTAVCNIAVRDAESQDDKEILARLMPIVADYKDELLSRRVRRLTFICGHKDGTYPGYYTFRGPSYDEDLSIRHIEPALAFQLELGRLSKFHIKPVFTENRNIHLYEAVAKNVDNDKRYFARASVRPGQLRDNIPTVEYMMSEADRLMTDILDAMEIVGNNNSDLNHIFINFATVLPVDTEEVENSLGGFLDRFGRRAWRLRVHGAEIRIVCTDKNTGELVPMRVIISNTSGFIAQVEIYAERKSDRGNEWLFHSIGPQGSNKVGSMHLRPVSAPYENEGGSPAEAIQGSHHGHPVRLRLPRALQTGY